MNGSLAPTTSSSEPKSESIFSFSELNIRLVWVDANMNSGMCRRQAKRLRILDSEIKTFEDPEDCIQFIRKYEEEKSTIPINLIVSGRLAEITISRVERYRCVVACYIYCKDRAINEGLRFGKLRSVCTDILELMKDIEYFNIKRDEKLGISIFKDPEAQPDKSSQNQPQISFEDEVRFMWNFQCYKFMVNIDDADDVKAKRDLCKYYTEKCESLADTTDKQHYLEHLHEFEKEPIEENKIKAINWYTRNSLFYRFTNEAVRKLNTKDIYAVRYMVKIICQKLQELHRQSPNTSRVKKVFRGQRIQRKALEFIHRNRGNFLSFKSFVSTSTSKETARSFLYREAYDNEVFAIFEIQLSQNIQQQSSAIFADISNYSIYRRENEILFSVGTMFRIMSVDQEEGNDYLIKLSLINREEAIFNDYIEKIYKIQPDKYNSSLIFGKLIYDMNEVDLARDHFLNSYKQLRKSDIANRADHLVNIAACEQKLKRFEDAIGYYKKAIELYEKVEHRQGLGICFYHMAVLFDEQNQINMANNYILKAINAQKRYPLEKASSLDFQGTLILKDNDYEEAKEKFIMAKKIRDKYLSENNPNHPEIGNSYRHLGTIALKLGDFQQAAENLQKAFEIFSLNYPLDDQRVTETRATLAALRKHL